MVITLKLVEYYIFNELITAQVTAESLFGILALPLRATRLIFRASHQLLKFEGARLAVTSALRRINRPVRGPSLRGFDWLKLVWFLSGETFFTLMFSILIYMSILLLAGFWTYISQEQLDKLSLIFVYFPFEDLFMGIKNYPIIKSGVEIYNINIKPLIYAPSKVLLTWDYFKTIVLDIFYVAMFKMGISLIHNWDMFIGTFRDMCLPYLRAFYQKDNLLQILAFKLSLLQVYFLEPTLSLMKAILTLPFKGITPLIATNWLGDIVWCFTAYYTKFQELYWKYVWDYEYIKGHKFMIKEYFMEGGKKFYTGYKYAVKDVWVSLIDGEKEALKAVQGESFVKVKVNAEQASTSQIPKGQAATPIPDPTLENPIASGRTSPVEQEAAGVQNVWDKGKGRAKDELNYDSDSSLSSTESGKKKQMDKYFTEDKSGEETPRPSATPLHVNEPPQSIKNMMNPIYQGAGVHKNGKIVYYERLIPTCNDWSSVGGPSIYSIQPDKAAEIQGTVSWDWFLMTNPKVISVLCFSSTLLAGLAIKGIIKLSVNTAVAVLG